MKINWHEFWTKLSDKERDAYFRSLTSQQYDRLCNRTFTSIEYSISWLDENGEIVDSNHADNLKDALKEFDNIEGDVILEKCKKYYNCVDCDLKDREYETIKTKGDEKVLKQGGWI